MGISPRTLPGLAISTTAIALFAPFATYKVLPSSLTANALGALPIGALTPGRTSME